MDVKAKCGFSGAVCMCAGEVKAVSDELAADLIQAGYAELVEEPKKKSKKEE